MKPNIREAIAALKAGRPILLLDANDRENEGDLVVAAEKIDAISMNFLIKKGSGVVCIAMPKNRLDALNLPMMHHDNTNTFQTAFTVSIEAKSGVSTGVSAKDRAHTIQVAIADHAQANDLARPGHVFPLAAKPGGVFERMGHTEGSVDLMNMAGLKPGAVLCELMNADGSMTVGDERLGFAREHQIPVVTVEEILFHRIRYEHIVSVHTQKTVPSRFGQLVWHQFEILGTKIDLFHSPSDLPDLLTLEIVNTQNLYQRFIGQALAPHDDDPLLVALGKFKHSTPHLVVAIIPEQDKRHHALLARAIFIALGYRKFCSKSNVIVREFYDH